VDAAVVLDHRVDERGDLILLRQVVGDGERVDTVRFEILLGGLELRRLRALMAIFAPISPSPSRFAIQDRANLR